MRHFIDGDQLCIVKDDFINLQESPVVFYSLYSDMARTILVDGILALPVGELQWICGMLKLQLEEELIK